jgi:lipopolysaccharide export system ATP-binding protein
VRTLKVPWFRSGNKDTRDEPALQDQWRLDTPASRKNERRGIPEPREPARPQPPMPQTAIPRAAPQPSLQRQAPQEPPSAPAKTWRPSAEEARPPQVRTPPPRPAAPTRPPAPDDEDFEIEQRLQRIARSTRANGPRPHAHPPHVPIPGEGILAAEGLQKTYGSRRVVNDVSIDVMRGEAVGILGPNGAGKTTCFYMVTGLVEPDAGYISLDGHDVTKLPMYRRARLGIGYLPQEASIFRGLNVENNLRAVLEVVEPNKARREQRLNELLDEFQIQHIRKSPSIALSGGERRRVEIARALATNPSYMLLDEPFAGIDPIAVGDIRKLVRHLTRRGIGVLITDHNVRETLGLVDRAYIIHSGAVLMEGTPEEIVESDEVRRLYLGEEFQL